MKRAALVAALCMMSVCSPPCLGNEPAESSESSIALPSLALLGQTMQQVLLALPPPSSVYLAGEDGEIPRPARTDGIVFRYETEIELDTEREAIIFINFDPEDYRVETVTAVLDEYVSPGSVVEALGVTSYCRERRRVETDDIDYWVTDEVDPEGTAEVLAIQQMNLEVEYVEGVRGVVFRFGSESSAGLLPQPVETSGELETPPGKLRFFVRLPTGDLIPGVSVIAVNKDGLRELGVTDSHGSLMVNKQELVALQPFVLVFCHSKLPCGAIVVNDGLYDYQERDILISPAVVF